jgi:hypothetical protein
MNQENIGELKRQISSFLSRFLNLGLELNLLVYHQFQKAFDFADNIVVYRDTLYLTFQFSFGFYILLFQSLMTFRA